VGLAVPAIIGYGEDKRSGDPAVMQVLSMSGSF
jgi:hypothetical protein